MKTIIIGVGNPIRRDDCVGLQVARELRHRLEVNPDVSTAELHCGGIRLMEAMVGYDRAFVIDAMVSGQPAGTVRVLEPAEWSHTRTTNSTHDAELSLALEFGRAAGLPLPTDVRIWAIEAADVESLGEHLTPAVESAAAGVVSQMLQSLGLDDSASWERLE